MSIPVLAELLESETAADRRVAARFLGEAGKEAGSALPALRRLRNDPDPTVGYWAELVVKRIEYELGD